MTAVTPGRCEYAVLIADDDAAMRETLREVVAGAGFSTLLASSGEEALDVVKVWKETGRVMQVGVQSTSLEVWDQARQMIDDGKLGKLLGFQTEYF